MNVDAEIETGLYWHCQWFKDEKASRGLLLSNSTYPPCCNFHHSWREGAKIWLHFWKCQETPLALQQKKERGKETNFNADCLGEGEMAERERKWLSVASQTFPEVAKQVEEMRPRFPRSAFQTVSLPNGENQEFPPNDCKVCPRFSTRSFLWSKADEKIQPNSSWAGSALLLPWASQMDKSDFPEWTNLIFLASISVQCLSRYYVVLSEEQAFEVRHHSVIGLKSV